jgi:hypothetical protein
MMTHEDGEFRLARRGYVPAIGVGLVALAALIAAMDKSPNGVAPAVFIGLFALLLAVLAAGSRVLADASALDVRFFGLRSTRLQWETIERVSFGMAFPSVSYAMTISAADGREAKVHLNWCERESALLGILFDQLEARQIAVDGDVAALMKRRRHRATGPELVHVTLPELARERPRLFRSLLVLSAILVGLAALTIRNPDDIGGGVLFGSVFGAISAPLWRRQPQLGRSGLIEPVVGLLGPLGAFAVVSPSLGAWYGAGFVIHTFIRALAQQSVREVGAGRGDDDFAPRFYGQPNVWPGLPTGQAGRDDMSVVDSSTVRS